MGEVIRSGQTAKAQELGGVRLTANDIPTPTKDTAGIELTCETQRATTVKPEALEP